MEEDIKILEGECDCIYFENGKCQYNNGKSKCDKGQAIENLLKRNYYLENEARKIINQELNKAQIDLYKNYIPISVIQKKIEEVNNSNGYSPVNKIFIEKVLNEILEEGRR